jgi:FAD/FMN-containing dehydrogenase
MRTTRMRTITVDAEARTVRVEAGVEWGEVAAALAPYGLTALAGSSPDVGVLGYTLGGGYSWLSRKHGLASSRVTAIELVTGDGVFRRVSAQHDPSVFWAVRGGGANFGVVCALEFEVLPMTEVYAGSLFFPIERGPELFRAHARWSRTAPDAATTAIRLLRIPDLPELPDFLRGQSFAMVTGAVDAPAADAEAILAPLRALGPMIDTFASMPTAALSSIMMDPPQPTPGRGDGLIIDELTDEAIDAIMAVAGPGQQTPLVAVDLRHLEGAVGRPDPRGGVVNHFPGRYLGFAIGVVAVPELAALIEGDLHRLRDGLAPWTSSRDYSNFREVATSARRFYADEDYDRLLRLRTTCDPRHILRSNHELS